MITKEKLTVYRKYNGDLDLWARIGASKEKSIMSDDDWYLIDSLIQDVIISQNKLYKKLESKTYDDEVKMEIIRIAYQL